jgi:hypothetical protein
MRKLLLFYLLGLFIAQVRADLSLNGYYENDPLILLKRGGAGMIGADMNRLRLKLEIKPTDKITLHLEPRYYFLFAKTDNIPLAGVTDIDQLVWDRVYLKLSSPLASLTVGKQRIAWGSCYLWNPTDVFNPLVLSFAVREEEEANADAVRFEVPLGAAGGLDGYFLTNNEWNKTKKGLRARTNIGVFDYSASFVDLGDNTSQIGFDFTGDAWQLGIRGEGALKNNGRLQYVLGGEYTLENGVGLNLEYFNNCYGQKDKANYDWAGYFSGSVQALGRDYLYLGANKILDELTQVRGSVVTNLDDLSFMIYPSFERSLSQYLDLYIEAMIMGGQGGSEFNPGASLDPSGMLGSTLFLTRFIYNY